MNQCKWCGKEGDYQFGWMDSQGEWRSKHYTCADHAQASMAQQGFEMQMERSREFARLLAKRPNRFYQIPYDLPTT